jgi:hypothetical protein
VTPTLTLRMRAQPRRAQGVVHFSRAEVVHFS